jgi:hypothetical protein
LLFDFLDPIPEIPNVDADAIEGKAVNLAFVAQLFDSDCMRDGDDLGRLHAVVQVGPADAYTDQHRAGGDQVSEANFGIEGNTGP